MTLYGVGLGPGEADLLTIRGKRVLETADVVYSPGRLSRSVAVEHVSDERIGDLDFPMTRDEEELRRAWRAAALEIAPRARDGTAAFVTLGDPNVYSTFGHLRRTLAAFHPDVGIEIVPGVSAVTAFATALGVEIAAGASLALREAARGAAPTGPDRMILFKVTDAPTTHEGLHEVGYDVVYGRRLFMEQGETIVTEDPDAIAERDYYTLAYAEKHDLDTTPATGAFEKDESAGVPVAESGAETSDGGSDGPSRTAADARAGTTDSHGAGSVAVAECAEGEGCGDETPEVRSR
ncbi:cobalt-factor II C(20)-methyltransferase [Halococcus saccharolyticus]|uniref:Cobalt-precorrin-2 C(20)-methyltransferase n=1 Tax=Halococcus saccharolyticus DSM 5350 TaxID=1227455 RepID=M0MHR0_9EURY|nr:cobalt-factor II C(20)-methyltransferase [Halococcus saccharolyticus]EMA44878.1 cobalt-precorrin-2 C(20)-methyltransferase [Halococcus saccharolyticus DSM 5350]